MEVVSFLKKLVSFNTVEDLQNNELIEWIEQFLESYNFKCTKIIDEKTKKMNLVAEIGENPELAFAGHLDTVPSDTNWNTNPFELTIKGNIAYGLGVSDMKGGISAFLKAITNIDADKMKKGLKLYFTFDEELYFKGIKHLIAKEEKIPQNLILAEPTDLIPVKGTKGLLDLEVKFFGKSAHSSALTSGINAILKANNFINELIEMSEELKQEQNSIFEIPYTTINIGEIKGGTTVNIVPNECTVVFDVRIINKGQNLIILDKIKKLIEKYDSELKIRVNIEPKINTNIGMIQTIEEITNKKCEVVNYVTEASFIKDTNTIILGVTNTSHQVDENIKISDLIKLVEIYEKIIEKYCY